MIGTSDVTRLAGFIPFLAQNGFDLSPWVNNQNGTWTLIKDVGTYKAGLSFHSQQEAYDRVGQALAEMYLKHTNIKVA